MSKSYNSVLNTICIGCLQAIDKMRRWPEHYKRSVAWVLLISFLTQAVPVYGVGADIVVDDTHTFLDQTQTGIDIVVIEKPSEHGISKNNFKQYNVSEAGVIINNSTAAGSTYLGGDMYKTHSLKAPCQT